MGQFAILHPPTMNPPSQNPNPTPPLKGILKKNNNNRNTEAAASSKKLVMGEVKILKRGESLNTILKEVNHHHPATTPEKSNRKASKVVIGVLPPKKRTENWSPRLEATKDELLCSTHRLGPDPEIVSKQMKKVSDCFAGSVFSDSPSPSSVPLPGFFRKNLVKDDATTNLRRILGLSHTS